MTSFNPIVVIAAMALVSLLIYAFISSTRKGFLGRRRGYELEHVDAINSVEDLEQLLGEDLVSPAPTGLLSILPESSDRYVRHSEREIVDLYGTNPFARLMVTLNGHLEKSHNVLVPWEYALLMGIGFMAGGGLGFFLIPAWWSALLLACGGSFIVAETILRRQEREYRNTVNKQAIGLIQLVIQGLRAGYLLPVAFERSARDLGDPIARELDGLLRASRGQVSFSLSCKAAIKDTTSSFLKKIYKVIIMCDANDLSGSQIAERLIVIRRNLLSEYALKLAMKAEAAGSAMARNFLIYIVPGLLFFLIKQTPFILQPLIAGPAGWAFIALGLGMYGGGWYSSKKVMETLEV